MTKQKNDVTCQKNCNSQVRGVVKVVVGTNCAMEGGKRVRFFILLGERSAPHMGSSIEISRDIYIYVCRFVYNSMGNPYKKTYAKCVGGFT